jgi:hypothetical protein
LEDLGHQQLQPLARRHQNLILNLQRQHQVLSRLPLAMRIQSQSQLMGDAFRGVGETMVS